MIEFFGRIVMRSAAEPKAWVESHVVRVAQSSFLITSTTSYVVAIDPFTTFPKGVKADVVLITHSHPDHFNASKVRSLLKPGTRVVFPASMKRSGADRGLATDALVPGDTRLIGPLTLTAVAAYNLKRPIHRRSQGFLGYLFTLDGLRLYHAGDTDLIPEMQALVADVALLPVGGLVTMNPVQASQAARELKAKVVVPMHYGKLPFTRQAGKKFASLFEGITVLA